MMQESFSESPLHSSTSSPRNSKSHEVSQRSFAKIFRGFDLYAKVDDDYKIKTNAGAFLSIFGWILIAILVIGEYREFNSPKFHEHMVVDTTFGQKLKINLDVTFHSISCAEVHLDAMDVAGDNQLDVEHEMSKLRLHRNGTVVNKPVSMTMHKDFSPKGCQSCYGAESETRQCCNTCDDLRKAYEEKGWSSSAILKKAIQCMHDPTNPFAEYEEGEGCRVSGYVGVNKVAGNFHIAHGESIVRDGRHIHQFSPEEDPKFNVSHTIHSLSFGETYPGMKYNPLDGVTRIVTNDIGPTGLYQYYIKLIPTIYTNEWGSKLFTNQFTVTEKYRQFIIPDANNTQVAAVLPGIFFIYELSPFMIESHKSVVPITHFLTKICAVVGGLFVVLGIVDNIFFRLSQFKRK